MGSLPAGLSQLCTTASAGGTYSGIWFLLIYVPSRAALSGAFVKGLLQLGLPFLRRQSSLVPSPGQQQALV